MINYKLVPLADARSDVRISINWNIDIDFFHYCIKYHGKLNDIYIKKNIVKGVS